MTAAPPEISVVVPTYNDAQFLPRCLRSVFAQTLPVRQVVLVDDGTTQEECKETIESLVNKHPDVLLIAQQNAGAAAARNLGLKAVDTEFVAFVDADDWLEPECLDARYKVFCEIGGLAGAFSGYRKTSNGQTIGSSTFRSITVDDPDPNLIGRSDGFPGGLPMYLFRTAAVRSLQGLDESLSIMEDFDFILRLMASGGRVAGHNSPLYVREVRQQSYSRRSSWLRLKGVGRFLRKARSEGLLSEMETVRRAFLAVAEFVSGLVSFGRRKG